MSLTFGKGEPIAMLKCDKKNKLNKKIIKLSDDMKGDNIMEFNDCEVNVLPSIKHVERFYISGPSGSGKSFFISKWLKMNRKIYKGDYKKDIYMFSRIEYDKKLDDFNPIRVNLEDLLTDPMSAEELEGTIVIFDDIDSISEPDVKNAVFSLRNDLLKCGRHFNITVLCTTHVLLNKNESRDCINESTSIVVFPRSGATYHIRELLKKYCGFEKNTIDHIMQIDTRWLCIRKLYPMCIIHENGIFMANKKF